MAAATRRASNGRSIASSAAAFSVISIRIGYLNMYIIKVIVKKALSPASRRAGVPRGRVLASAEDDHGAHAAFWLRESEWILTQPKDHVELDLDGLGFTGVQRRERTLGGIDDHPPDTPDRVPERL